MMLRKMSQRSTIGAVSGVFNHARRNDHSLADDAGGTREPTAGTRCRTVSLARLAAAPIGDAAGRHRRGVCSPDDKFRRHCPYAHALRIAGNSSTWSGDTLISSPLRSTHMPLGLISTIGTFGWPGTPLSRTQA